MVDDLGSIRLSIRNEVMSEKLWHVEVCLKAHAIVLLDRVYVTNYCLITVAYRPFSYCVDYCDLNGLGHLPEFADQKSGRQILVNGPTRSDRR